MELIDPRLYGGEVQSPTDVPTSGAGAGVGQAVPNPDADQRTAPAFTALVGTDVAAQGAAINAAAERERASVVQSVGGAFVSTDTAAVLRTITDPTFPKAAEPLNTFDLFQSLDFVPTDDEANYLKNIPSQSVQEWSHKLDRVKLLRQAREAAGDHWAANLLTSVVGDAGYLLTGAGSMAVATKFGRVAGVAAGAAQGSAFVGAAAQSQPKSTEEIILGIAGEMAAGAFVFNKAGKMVPKDADFPAAELGAALAKKPRMKQVSPAEYVDGVKTKDAVWAEVPVQAKPALDNPDALVDTPLVRQHTNLRAAVADLAETAQQPFIRQVMRLIAPYVPEGKIRVLDDTVDPRVREAFTPTTRAMAVADDLATDVYVNPTKGVGQETLAHELLHTATIRKLADNAELKETFKRLISTVRMSLSTDLGHWPINNAVRKQEQQFFQQVFGGTRAPDVDEFLAYAFTAPSFQRMMDGMDSAGMWIKAAPVPGAPKPMTLWQQVVQWVAGLFGGTTKVAAAFEQAMRLRDEAIAAQPKTLRAELEDRLANMLNGDAPAGQVDFETKMNVGTTPADVVASVDAGLQKGADNWGKRIGGALQWNVHKTLSSYGPVGKKIADLLVDNNSDLSINSVESIARGVKADLTRFKWEYDDGMRAAMAEDGFGLKQQIFNTRAAMLHQQKLHEAVKLEMFRREQLFRKGLPITFDKVEPRIKKMADSLDKMYKLAADELVSAGVEGAEELKHFSGFFNRRWSAGSITTMTDRFMAAGQDAKKAHQSVVKLVALGMRRANNWDDLLAYNVAAETVSRALRKGLQEDAPYITGGNELAAQVRDRLAGLNITGAEAQRVLDVVVGKQDEVGKAGFLKHRIDVDYSAAAMVDGEMVRLTDLIDNNITDIADRYIDGVSTQVGFARKGLTKPSDITALRTELMEATKRDPHAQKEAKDLFDGLVGKMRGEPVGPDLGRFLRNSQAFTRMVALPWSGLWQTTEIATPMVKYGALATIKHAVRQMPGFKQLLNDAARDPKTSQHLVDVLTRGSNQSLRLRPFIQRLEDGYEIPESATLDMALAQAQQLIPYSNGLKYIHNFQANVVGNLITDIVASAAKGDVKAAEHLAKYGVDADALAKVRASVERHGFEVDKWDDGAWEASRPAFVKMMDESVLSQRLGDTPQFALLNPVGKYIMTFRSFTLTAHNKVLAGSMGRDGLAAVSLLMLYQFPLAALAVQAQAKLNGKPALHEEELAFRAMGQMGVMGMFTDVTKIISGDMQNFGNPAMIATDRAIKFSGNVLQGDMPQAMEDGVKLIPLMGLPAKAIGAALNP